MTRSHFELGLSGHGVACSCATLADVFTACETLAPGSYWIVQRFPRRLAPIDWGTLEIRDRGDWCLRGPNGLQAGPSYAVV